jgi:hypothetical protein
VPLSSSEMVPFIPTIQNVSHVVLDRGKVAKTFLKKLRRVGGKAVLLCYVGGVKDGR